MPWKVNASWSLHSVIVQKPSSDFQFKLIYIMFVPFDISARIILYFKIVILCLPSWSTYSLSDLVTLLCTYHILNWFLLRMVDQEIVPSFWWNLIAVRFLMAVTVPYSVGSNSHRSWNKDCIYLFYRYISLHGNRNITAAGTCQGRNSVCLGCLTWNPPLCMCSPSRQDRLGPAPGSTCLTPSTKVLWSCLTTSWGGESCC